MELVAALVTVGVFLGLGYVVLRAYWKGNVHGLNSELFD
jgi:hypothetical protein